MSNQSKKREARIRALWAQVKPVACKGLCFESCSFIEMSKVERVMLERASGCEQTTTASGDCSLLKNGRCSAYATRPMLCRLFGTIPEMPCRHGCEQTMTSAHGRRLMLEADRIGGAVSKERRVELLETLARELGWAT